MRTKDLRDRCQIHILRLRAHKSCVFCRVQIWTLNSCHRRPAEQQLRQSPRGFWFDKNPLRLGVREWAIGNHLRGKRQHVALSQCVKIRGDLFPVLNHELLAFATQPTSESVQRHEGRKSSEFVPMLNALGAAVVVGQNVFHRQALALSVLGFERLIPAL